MIRSLLQLFARNPWLAWLWSILILIACTWPGKDLPAAPTIQFDKVVHMGLFFIWISLYLLAYPGKTRLLIISGMAYGVALEFYQQLLPFDRTFDWWDAAADAAGVLLGAAFMILVIKPYRQRLY